MKAYYEHRYLVTFADGHTETVVAEGETRAAVAAAKLYTVAGTKAVRPL